MIILATRFLAELVGVATLVWLGASAPVDGLARALLAIAAPAGLMAVWGLVVAPKADNPLPLRTRELIGTGLLLGVAGALALAGQPAPAAIFAAIVVIDWLLMVAFDPGAAMAARPSRPTV